jgi:hypothetical protein
MTKRGREPVFRSYGMVFSTDEFRTLNGTKGASRVGRLRAVAFILFSCIALEIRDLQEGGGSGISLGQGSLGFASLCSLLTLGYFSRLFAKKVRNFLSIFLFSKFFIFQAIYSLPLFLVS